jgi:uncharacterized membrane protein YccC
VSGHAYGGREHDEGVVDEKCLLCALEEERALRQDNRRWAERAEAQLAAATERAEQAEAAAERELERNAECLRHIDKWVTNYGEAEAQLAAARELFERLSAAALPGAAGGDNP